MNRNGKRRFLDDARKKQTFPNINERGKNAKQNGTACRRLKKSAVLQVILNDDIGDGIEDELNVVRVGGAGEVRINLFLIFSLIEILEFHSYVARCFFVRVGTWNNYQMVI